MPKILMKLTIMLKRNKYIWSLLKWRALKNNGKTLSLSFSPSVYLNKHSSLLPFQLLVDTWNMELTWEVELQAEWCFFLFLYVVTFQMLKPYVQSWNKTYLSEYYFPLRKVFSNITNVFLLPLGTNALCNFLPITHIPPKSLVLFIGSTLTT